MRASTPFVHRSLAALMVGVVALAACDSVTRPEEATAARFAERAAIGGGGSGNGGPGEVRFAGRFEFAADLLGETIDCGVGAPLPATYSGTGIMSHLGRSTVSVTWETCELIGGQVVTTGAGYAAAANGDTIYVTFTQTFTALVPEVSSVFHLDPVAIVGGAGRFASVTGSGTGHGTTAGFDGEFELSGTMTPPGVSKHVVAGVFGR